MLRAAIGRRVGRGLVEGWKKERSGLKHTPAAFFSTQTSATSLRPAIPRRRCLRPVFPIQFRLPNGLQGPLAFVDQVIQHPFPFGPVCMPGAVDVLGVVVVNLGHPLGHPPETPTRSKTVTTPS